MRSNIFGSALMLIGMSSAAYAQDALDRHIVQTVEAEQATGFNSFIRRDETTLSNIFSGDWFSINTGDLGPGIDTITLHYAKADRSDVNVEIRQGSLNGPIIAGGRVPTTQGLTQFETLTFTTAGLAGTNDLFFVFTGGGTVGAFDNIEFGRSQKNVLEAEDSIESFGVDIQDTTITNISPGDWLRFEDVRLGNGFSDISLAYRKRSFLPASATFHLDDLDGPIIGSVSLPRTGQMPEIISKPLMANEGTHDIFVKFSGFGRISMLDYMSFEEQPLKTNLDLTKADIVRGLNYFANEELLNLDINAADGFHWFRFNRTSVSYNPKIEFEYAKGSHHPMQLEVRKNAATGKVISTLDLPFTGGYNDYQTISMRLDDTPEGIYNLVFRLVGTGRLKIGDIELTRIGESDSLPLGETDYDRILVDQFGYKPEMGKVALIRDGEVGLGSDDRDYIPGDEISLVDANTNQIIFSSQPEEYDFGTTDPLSGDKIWSFDFSSHETPGSYYIYDAVNNTRSASFDISENIYENVLRETFRTFVYQRSGFEKTAEIVGENYTDEASHTAHLQDSSARKFNSRKNRASERDLSGGWYDAGDFKKYSNWTADYILGLLHAYHQNPEAWSDDWNLPDSGNGIPDILDEVRWGVEHLQRMQETASEVRAENIGAILSVLDSENITTPPSENVGESFYGAPSTSATYTSAGAFAFAASTFKELSDPAFQELADSLSDSAIAAYSWAEKNPNVRFNNPENGVGNGNSEVTDNYFLDAKHRIAAIYLYGLTQERKYKNFVESDFRNSRLLTLLWASPYEIEEPTALLHYATLDGINPQIGLEIKNRFNEVMETAGNARPALEDSPYRSYIQEYVWGSNKFVSRKGDMFAQLASYDIGVRTDRENLDVAAGYLHYIHGVNPLGKVYLTNMSAFGAERSMDEFYHAWFADGSQWDNVNSSFGPPPGYLVGGPNQFYSGTLDLNQPPMKSFAETNATQNNERSWELTENSNGYQIEYLKLLSQFVR